MNRTYVHSSITIYVEESLVETKLQWMGRNPWWQGGATIITWLVSTGIILSIVQVKLKATTNGVALMFLKILLNLCLSIVPMSWCPLKPKKFSELQSIIIFDINMHVWAWGSNKVIELCGAIMPTFWVGMWFCTRIGFSYLVSQKATQFSHCQAEHGVYRHQLQALGDLHSAEYQYYHRTSFLDIIHHMVARAQQEMSWTRAYGHLLSHLLASGE